jgi:glutamate-1-semialdehyde 2,1-aminomutase
MLVKSGSGLAGLAESDSAGVPPHVAADTIVVNLDDTASFDQAMAAYGPQIAAVIIEPLPANYGLLIQSQEFLQHVARQTKAHGSLLILDEVISGFRVGLHGMAGVSGLRPDLVTYGKAIGGGFPVGCYGGRRDLMDLVAPAGPVYQAGTLSANPVGMVSGLATLAKVKRINGLEVLNERTERFVKDMQKDLDRYELPVQISCFGSLFWVHRRLASPIRRIDQIPADHASKFAPFFHACLQEGVYLAPSGYEVGFTSLAHDFTLLQEAGDKIVRAARKTYG